MAAGHGAAGLGHFAKAAAHDLLEDAEIGVLGKADHGQRGDGPAAHGIDVAQCVGGGDLAEGEGVVNQGSEEVDGLHQREIGRDAVDAGVVGGLEADQQVGIGLHGKRRQHAAQRARARACWRSRRLSRAG